MRSEILSFSDQLKDLVAKELAATEGLGFEARIDRLTEALETLCGSAGLCVAAAAKGHPEAI